MFAEMCPKNYGGECLMGFAYNDPEGYVYEYKNVFRELNKEKWGRDEI